MHPSSGGKKWTLKLCAHNAPFRKSGLIYINDGYNTYTYVHIHTVITVNVPKG